MQVLPPVSVPVKCLAQGDRAPAFEMVDPAFGIIRSSQLLRIGPVLLTFYRGAWCQCCQIDLRDLANTMPSFTNKNVSVLAVFHGLNSEMNARIRQTYNLSFPLVDDPYGRAAHAFGIRRSRAEMAAIENEFGPELLALKEGQPWITPMQARYLIVRDGVITHSEIVTRYEDRSSAAYLLPLLEEFG